MGRRAWDDMATLRDIAKRAGVAPSTVSAILNNRADCYASEQTRRRVREVAEELGYRPNRLARGLVQGRSRLLGLLVNVRYPVFAAAAAGIEDAAAAAGYGVLLCHLDGRATSDNAHLEVLAASRVEGLIAVSSSERDVAPPLLQHKPAGTPLVSINRRLDHDEVLSLLVDNFDGARAATARLQQLERHRIVYLGGRESGPTVFQAAIDRRDGYLAAMAAAGLSAETVALHWSSPAELAQAAETAALRVLGDATAPVGFVCLSDYAALGVLRAAAQLGRTVPDDVAVVGFDNLPIAEVARPPLTTVAQPFYEAGRLAVERLLGWPHDPQPGEQRLACELILRDSA